MRVQFHPPKSTRPSPSDDQPRARSQSPRPTLALAFQHGAASRHRRSRITAPSTRQWQQPPARDGAHTDKRARWPPSPKAAHNPSSAVSPSAHSRLAASTDATKLERFSPTGCSTGVIAPSYREPESARSAAGDLSSTQVDACGPNKNWVTFAGANTPALITARITKSPTLETLCELLGTGGQFVNFNAISLSAAVNRLGKLVADAGPGYLLPDNLPAVLARLVAKSEATIPTFDPRAIASLLYGIAVSGFLFVDALTGSTRRLYAALVKDIELRRYELDAFKPQELSNIAWGLAKVEWHCAVFAQIATHVNTLLSLREYTAQGLCNIAWSMARMGHRDDDLFDRLAAEALARRFSGFEPQHVSNLAWAMAALGYTNDGLLAGLFAFLDDAQLAQYDAQNLSNVAWSVAQLHIRADALMKRIAAATCAHVRTFDAQQLAIIAWAFAKLGVNDVALFASIANELRVRDLTSFDPQTLAVALWGFAVLGVVPASEVFTRVRQHCQARVVVSACPPASLANLAWAFARAGERCEGLLAAVDAHVADLDEFGPSELANLVWAFAASGSAAADAHASLFARAARRCMAVGVSAFDAPSLANALWAFAVQGGVHDDVVRAIVHEVEMRELAAFTEQDLGMVAWASSALAMDNAGLLGAFARECCCARGPLPVDSEALADLAWAFACAKLLGAAPVRAFFQRDVGARQGHLATSAAVTAERQREVVAAWLYEVGTALPPVLAAWRDAAVVGQGTCERVRGLATALEEAGCRCAVARQVGPPLSARADIWVTTPEGREVAVLVNDGTRALAGAARFRRRLLVKAVGSEDRVRAVVGWRHDADAVERASMVRHVIT